MAILSREKSVRSSISSIKTVQELKSQYGSFKNDRLLCKINEKIELRRDDEIDNVPLRPKKKRSKVIRSESRKDRIKSAMVSFSPDAKLSDLTRITEKDDWFRRNRSRVYFYLVPLLTLYYFVPAIQISFLSKQPQDLIGSRDLCYHNFRCSIPFYIFSDFNHIISNITYAIFGIAFNFLVWQKGKRLSSPENEKSRGDNKCISYVFMCNTDSHCLVYVSFRKLVNSIKKFCTH